MKKKIIRHGPSSLIVALPSSWVKRYQLQGGEEVTVEERGNRLTISLPSPMVSRKHFTVEVPSEKFIRLLISTPVKQGYDEVKISFKDPAILSIIQKEVGSLIGFDVVETTKDYCIIRSIAKESEEEFDTILRRTFLLLLQMAEESHAAIKNLDLPALQSIVLYEKKNNSYTNFCKRILNKGTYQNPEKSHFLYAVLRLLEEIADEYRDIGNAILSSKTKLSLPVLEVYQKTNKLLSNSYHLFYNFSFKSAENLTATRELLQQEGEKMLLKNANPFYLHHLLNIVVKSYSLLGSIYGLNL